MFGAIELRQRRAALIDDAGAILTTASTEGRALTPEDRERFDRMHADADAMGEDITRIERQEQQARDLATTANARQDVRRDLNLGPAGPSNDEAVNAALVGAARRQWMRFGLAGMSAEQRAVANFADSATMQAAIEALPPEQRIAQTVTTGGGGYLIEQEWMQEIDVAMLKYGNMREACRVITTATGALIPYPTLNDTGNAGRLLAINQPITNVALAYGVVNMQAYKYSSDSILVPSELAQDSAFDIDGHVRDQLAIRLGRITNTHFATGTGSGQPQGITVGAADSGVDLDISGGQTYANWVAFEHSIDPDYRLGAGFIMHDTVLENAKAVLDGNSRPSRCIPTARPSRNGSSEFRRPITCRAFPMVPIARLRSS